MPQDIRIPSKYSEHLLIKFDEMMFDVVRHTNAELILFASQWYEKGELHLVHKHRALYYVNMGVAHELSLEELEAERFNIYLLLESLDMQEE